jgi:Uma2 family endonuclease
MQRSSTAPRYETVAQLLEQLGDVDPVRIRLDPPPGKATEKHLLALHARTDRLYELVDGVLVEKVMGYLEGTLANWLSFLLQTFLETNDLGNLAGSDATMRLMPGLVRLPDLSFIRWERLPVRGQLPTEPIPDLVPDLAIEVLSESNRPGEMARKLKDYFLAGVRLVWFVDPHPRTVEVFTAPDESRVLTESDTLDGGEVLPGLQLPVQRIFAKAPLLPPKRKRQPRK